MPNKSFGPLSKGCHNGTRQFPGWPHSPATCHAPPFCMDSEMHSLMRHPALKKQFALGGSRPCCRRCGQPLLTSSCMPVPHSHECLHFQHWLQDFETPASALTFESAFSSLANLLAEWGHQQQRFGQLGPFHVSFLVGLTRSQSAFSLPALQTRLSMDLELDRLRMSHKFKMQRLLTMWSAGNCKFNLCARQIKHQESLVWASVTPDTHKQV